MKALIIDNEIKRKFQAVPKFLKEFSHVQRPDLLDEQELADRNIHIVEIEKPEIDIEIEELVNERFDSVSNKVIYDKVDLEIDLETERTQKLKEFEQIIENEMMDALKIGVLEKLVLGEPVAQETKDKVIALRSREAAVITLINQVSDPKVLRKFGFDRTEIEADKAELKSARKI